MYCIARLVELKGMADRIISMRTKLKGHLEALGKSEDFCDHFTSTVTPQDQQKIGLTSLIKLACFASLG